MVTAGHATATRRARSSSPSPAPLMPAADTKRAKLVGDHLVPGIVGMEAIAHQQSLLAGATVPSAPFNA